MPDISVANLKQKAVYWAPAAPDKHGQRQWASPVNIPVRYTESVIQTRSQESTTEAKGVQPVFSDRQLQAGGLLMLGGTLRDLPITDDSSTWLVEIKVHTTTWDINGRNPTNESQVSLWGGPIPPSS